MCQLCIKEGKEKATVYIGESARTPYDRGVEHLRLIQKNDTESPAVEHTTEAHPGQETSFTMEVITFPKTTLQRQVLEGHHIALNEKQNLINRRGEWGQNLPPKMIIEGQEQTIGKRQRGRQGQEGQKKRRRVKSPEAHRE